MTAVRHLRVIDADGEVFETADAEEENKALRAALTRLQRSYDALKADKAHERRSYVNRALIDSAFEDWKDKLVAAGFKSKKRCKLSDDRFDAMCAMVEAGYTLRDFQLANTGIAAFPYEVYGKRRQTGPKDSLEIDIGRVCERARRFEAVANLGAIVERAEAELDSERVA